MTLMREIRCCLFAAVATVAAVNAQAPRATIEGDVTDQSGAALPDVTITILNTSTGVVTTTKTDSAGHFYVPYLNPGVIYRVSGEKQGFQRVVAENVQTVVNEVTRVRLALRVGSLTQEVTVSAVTPVLTTANATLGGVVDNQKLRELPLKGRNPYSLVALVPGVRPSAGLNDLPVDQISTAYASINGARANQNEYLLDGAPNSAPAQNQPVVFPSADVVEEFKVDTSGYSAEFGRAGGGVFNVVTKSGGSQFRGDIYEFFRNDKLDAKNFFAGLGDLKPKYRFNQFGASLGGPVIFPKLYDGRKRGTFFFINYEGARVVQGVTYTATVPTDRQRQGDFSQTFNNKGQLIQIFDPGSTQSDPNHPGKYIRDPFLGNIIPPDQIDTVAKQLLQFIPLPNARGDPITGVNNFVSAEAQFIQKDTGMIRIDHAISANQKIFGRLSWDDTPQIRANVFGNVGSPSFGPQVFNRRGFIFDDVLTITPTLILDWHYSFSRLTNVRTPRSFGFDIASVGFPENLAAQIGPPSLPAITVSGMGGSFSIANQGTAALLGGNDFIRFGMDTHAWQGAISKVKGRHTIKSGAEFRLMRFNTTQHGDTANNFTFGAGFTQGPDPNTASQTAGFGFASFLLGTGGGAISIVPHLALQQLYTGVFVSDNIRATRKLTLNVGLRYDYESPRTDRFDQLSNFDANAALPLPGLSLRGGLTFVGVNGSPRGQWNPERSNVSPRVDFAYAVFPRTVVRGGFGLFYAATTGVGADAAAFGVSGFGADTTFFGSRDGGLTPFRFLRDPYPDGINQPTGSRLGAMTLLGQSIQFVDRNLHTPYAEDWNFSVQRELPGNTLVQAAYTGSRGIHLFAPMEWNQLPDEDLKLGTQLQVLVDNPFYGQIMAGPLSSAQVSRAQLLRPFPQFTGVSPVNSTRGASTYHAFEVQAEKRMGRGVSFTAAYTFSKLIDDVNSGFAGESLSGGGGVQDYNNLRAERSVSNIDQPQRFVASYLWQLPFGPGRRFAGSSGGFAGRIVGGWQIGGLLTIASGPPLGVTCATNNTHSEGGGCRPNLVGDPRLDGDQPTIGHFFNTSAFAQPDAFTFGNAGRFIPSLRGDGTKNFDFSLSKTTPLTEHTKLEFRGEFFNLFNRPQFAPPNTSFAPTNAKFGTVSSQANLPRDIQLAMKLYF